MLDASALLAVANAEAGAGAVTGRPGRAVMSAINLAEVHTKLLQADVSAAEIALGVGSLVAEVVPLDRPQAEAAAALHARTRHLGLSLADAVCLNLGAALGVPVLTTDRYWARVEGVGPVQVIR